MCETSHRQKKTKSGQPQEVGADAWGGLYGRGLDWVQGDGCSLAGVAKPF